MQKSTALLVLTISSTLAFQARAEPVSFRAEIAPLLVKNCLACHGPQKAEGVYRVDSYDRLLQEGDSGERGFVAKDVDASEAFRRITSDDPDERMPLEADPLSKDEIARIRRWIEGGAKYDAKDPKLPLISILPPPVHPQAPTEYPATLPITALAFSPDGTELFVGGYHELTVWNPEDGELVRRIGNIGQRTHALAFSPNGKSLAVACGAPGSLGELRLINPADGQLQGVLTSTNDDVFDVAFDPSGKRIAAVAADGVLRVFDVATHDLQLEITSHSDWVSAVAWSPQGDRLATASRDKTAKVFDAKTGELVVTYNGHSDAVAGVAFHPDGKEVYTSAADRRIHRWKIEDGKKSADVGSFGGELYKLTASADFLFAVSADKTARQYDRKTHKEVRKYTGHGEWVLSSTYHDDSKRLATGGLDGEVRVWSTSDGKTVTTFVAAPGLK